jgi:N-acetylneuraminic acid mutarotase
MYESSPNNILREYDPVTGQWKTTNKFPGRDRLYPTLFCLENKVYLGLGAYYKDSELAGVNDFFALDTKSNQWSRITDDPKIEGQTDPYPTSVVANGKGYIFNGVPFINVGAAEGNAFRYDPQQDKWIVLSPYASGREVREGIAFELNGRMYVSRTVDEIEDWPLYEAIGNP